MLKTALFTVEMQYGAPFGNGAFCPFLPSLYQTHLSRSSFRFPFRIVIEGGSLSPSLPGMASQPCPLMFCRSIRLGVPSHYSMLQPKRLQVATGTFALSCLTPFVQLCFHLGMMVFSYSLFQDEPCHQMSAYSCLSPSQREAEWGLPIERRTGLL